MSQRPVQQPAPPPPPDRWGLLRQQEMQKREQEKAMRKRLASKERMESDQRSNKMFHIEHGPDHETAGEMYRRIKAESKRPKSHAFRKGIMKGFSAAMLAQKAAREDMDKQLNDSQEDEMNESMEEMAKDSQHSDVVQDSASAAAEHRVDAELEELRRQIELGENQTLVRLYDGRGKSTGFGVVDESPGASFDNMSELPTLPNGQKPKYLIPDHEANKRHGINKSAPQTENPQESKKTDFSPAGRKLPDISHIKEPSHEAEHAFEMVGSK